MPQNRHLRPPAGQITPQPQHLAGRSHLGSIGLMSFRAGLLGCPAHAGASLPTPLGQALLRDLWALDGPLRATEDEWARDVGTHYSGEPQPADGAGVWVVVQAHGQG